ncbi:MAG: nuclear transport factor 2 family protein [Alphaproteobacteria bacterium]|nr:nuclear transport factor 2 family protein [Alphaproteobacteria bacterium]
MRRLVLTAGIAAATLGNALASELELVCVKAGDERKIEVVAPGVVGKSCDVQYSHAASVNVSTPYHANNSQDYCMLKAAELAETLKASGYACAPVGVLRTEAARVAPAAVAPASVTPVATAVASEPVAVPQAAAPTALAPIDLPPTESIAAPEILTAAPIAAPEPAPVAAPPVATAAAKINNQPAAPGANAVRVVEADAALEDKMSQILAEPPVDQTAPAPEAFKGPAQLTAQIDEPLPGARPTAPVGRLVGATPEPRAAVSVTPAAVTQAAPVAEPAAAAPEEKALPPQEEAKPAPAPAAVVEAEPAAKPAEPPAAAPAKAAKRSKSAKRTPADIVLATLNAQVAAWNEGNLDAFMKIYWKSDDLKFISGVKMTKGWSSTQKRYREEYADGTGLGRLSVDKTDVEMVTDDVAIVTGRFTHNKGGVNTGGVFSLVWKRINGQWRIVHDHSAVDPVAP